MYPTYVVLYLGKLFFYAKDLLNPRFTCALLLLLACVHAALVVPSLREKGRVNVRPPRGLGVPMCDPVDHIILDEGNGRSFLVVP